MDNFLDNNKNQDWEVVTNEIVLRGGKPWGFQVSGGCRENTLLLISQVEEGGKADKTGQIIEGDCLLAVNNVDVTDQNEAIDLINGAFKTLTIKTARGNFEQTQPASPNATFIKHAHELHEGELDRSQDDSLVFKESPSKKLGTKLKSQRRGESFNLKNTGPAGTWTNSESTESVNTPTKRKFSFKKLAFVKRSTSADQKPKDIHDNNYHSGDGAQGDSSASSYSLGNDSDQQRSHIVQSTPALLQYGDTYNNSSTTAPTGTDQLASNNMPHSTSWQGQSFASQSTSSLDYSNNNGDNTKENEHPGYKSVFEYKLSQINKSYSTSAIRPTTSSQSSYTYNSQEATNRRWRGHNYENISLLETGNLPSSPTVTPVVSSPYYATEMNTNNTDEHSGPPYIPTKTFGHMGNMDDNLYSPNASTKDAVFYNGKSTSKHSNWSKDYSNDNSVNDTSWSESNHSLNEGSTGNKPTKLFYQPRSFNPRLEDVSSKDVKRHLEENRLKSPKDPPLRQPMVAKADSMGDMGRAFQFDPESIENTQKNYMDNNGKRNWNRDSSPQHEIKRDIVETKEIATSPPPTHTQPPPVPDNSPPQLTPPQKITKDSSVLNDVSWNVVNTPSAGYMYIVRQKPCYNTSTQTDTPAKVIEPSSPNNLKSPSEPSLKNAEVQAGSNNNTPLKPRLLKEERGIQARPGSIVAANIAVNSKSVGVGGEGDYDNLSIWDSPKTITANKGANDNKNGEQKEAAPVDVKPKSPKGSVVSSQQYYLREDDLAKINSQTDTEMMRKLSQEYYSQIKGSNRHSGNFEDRKSNDLKDDRTMGDNSKNHLKQKSEDKGYSSGIESKVSKATKNTLLELRKDIDSYERQENIKKSHNVPFEPVDYNDNKRERQCFLSHGQPNVLNKYNIEQQQKQLQSSYDSKCESTSESMEIKQLSIDSGVSSIVDSHRIAEQARKEWIQSGKFKDYGRPKALKRTVSEQIKPDKDKNMGKQMRGRKSVSTTEAEKERMKKMSDPSNQHAVKVGEHAYQSSDPTQDYKIQQNPQTRFSSDSDSVFNGRDMDRKNRPNSNISTKSSSSGSTGVGDERNRTSDPELKMLQQKAVLNFVEMKSKIKSRASSSSLDSNSFSSEVSTPKDNQDRRFPKSLSSPHKLSDMAVGRKAPPKNLEINTRRHSTNSRLTSGRKDISSSEITPPPLLDTSVTSPVHNIRGHSYSSSSATSTSLSPRGDPHSPPLHPWPSNLTPTKEDDETDVKVRLPSKIPEGKREVNHSNNKNSNEHIQQSIQYSTSSTENSPPGISPSQDKMFAYQVSLNRSLMEDEEENVPAPTLPPRNYRTNYTTRQVPQPMEPPLPVGRQSSSGQSNDSQPQTDSSRSSTSQQYTPGSVGRLSSSSYTDVFTNDYESTPARDKYADQLRMQSRRISQSQTSYLNPAKFQQKSLSDFKTNVVMSRPVEKPSVGTSQPLNNSVISKDYPGLSNSGDSVTNNSAKNDRRYSNTSANELPVIKGSSSRHSLGSNNSYDLPSARGKDRYSISSAGELNTPRSTTIHHSPQGSMGELNSYRGHHSPQGSMGGDNRHHHSPQGSNVSEHRHSPQVSGINEHRYPHHHHSPQGSSSSDKGSAYLSPIQQQQQQQRAAPTTTSNNNMYVESPNNTYDVSQQQQLSADLQKELDDLPPPPPPPHQTYQHSPSGSMSENKPLPPLPKEDSGGSVDPEGYSSGSYITNKNNHRRVYGGNYHNNNNPSPLIHPSVQDKQQPPSINPPNHETMVHVTKVLTVNNNSTASHVENGDNNSINPPWNKSYSPVQSYTNNRHSPNMETPNNRSTSRGNSSESQEEIVESPSVKTFVANFENRESPSHRAGRGTPVTRGKINELKQSLWRSSNENLSETNSSDGKRSRSNSRENILLNSSVSSEEIRSVSIQQSSTEDITSKYNDTSVPDIQECQHHRDKSDPQSDGDTRSNDSGVAEDISHIRQKSQEEIDCEKQALLVASQLKDQDKHLSEVILPRPEHKISTDYVSGLFDTKVNVMHKPSIRVIKVNRSRSNSIKSKSLPESQQTPNKSDSNAPLPSHSPYWSPPPLADLQNRMRQEGLNADDILKDMHTSGATIEKEKSELIGKIEKKIDILKEEGTFLREEIEQNEALGKELYVIVEQKIENKAELNKYKLYVSELDKVTILLLKLSGRLARVENGIMSLSEDASEQEKTTLYAKRDELQEKLEDAKSLKEGIDRRSKQVSVFLTKHLTSEEYGDYGHFIKMKSKLTIDQQEIEDKIKLGQEQLSALKKSMNQSEC